MKSFYLLLVSSLLLFSCTTDKTTWMKIYIGTYTDGKSEGIYTLKFNPETGELDSLELKATLPNPSFLALSEDKTRLYAVQETADFDTLGGGVSAFKITGDQFEEINSKGTGGAHPCHVSLSNNGQLAVSNYSGGNVAVFDLDDQGGLADRQLLQHNPADTTGMAHAHKATFSNNALFVADLGLDAVKRYAKQPYGFIPAHQATLEFPKGAGPRHFVFNSDASFLYVINELNSSLTVFKQDKEGSYLQIQNVSTLAENFTGESFCADIHLSSDGNFLYGSNRGENTIVIFKVDKDSGKIETVGRENVQGDWPRNFTLSPDGKFLLVANQKSNNISVFKRDSESGGLIYAHDYKINAPVCLVFN